MAPMIDGTDVKTQRVQRNLALLYVMTAGTNQYSGGWPYMEGHFADVLR